MEGASINNDIGKNKLENEKQYKNFYVFSRGGVYGGKAEIFESRKKGIPESEQYDTWLNGSKDDYYLRMELKNGFKNPAEAFRNFVKIAECDTQEEATKAQNEFNQGRNKSMDDDKGLTG